MKGVDNNLFPWYNKYNKTKKEVNNMKFYSYSNNNKNYTRAISLNNIRSISTIDGGGKSAIRFGVRVDYMDGQREDFYYLEKEESEKVYKEILDILNKEA